MKLGYVLETVDCMHSKERRVIECGELSTVLFSISGSFGRDSFTLDSTVSMGRVRS